jgi:nitric oxide dioxygenase
MAGSGTDGGAGGAAAFGVTSDQIALVEQSFAMIRPMKGQAAGLLFRRLVETAPEAAPLLAGANMTSLGMRLMATLNLLVGSLRRPPVLIEASAELGRRLAANGVRPEHGPPFGAALIWTLEQGLGPAFDDETRAAWTAAHEALSGVMIASAAPSRDARPEPAAAE